MSSNSTDPLLETRDLCLGYGAQTVLQGIDMRLDSGEFWFLLGQNGTGKSTLLKAIAGLLPVRSGLLRLHPRLSNRRLLGFVPLQPEINPTLPTTVREFVHLGLVGIHVGRKDADDRLEWALEHVGLEGKELEDYWVLSGGQRQRALVARALARRPELLVMDEPTAGLDPAAESALMKYLSSLNHEEGLSIVCVSHDLATAARHASHVALFGAGTVVTGPAAKVLTRANIKRVYGMAVDLGSRANSVRGIQENAQR